MKQTRVGAYWWWNTVAWWPIFTERDALFRVLAEGLNPDVTPLSEVMTPPIDRASDKPFAHVPHMMYENGFRHVPVAENGRPLGMVSARDALALEAEEFEVALHRREHLREILG